jgi:hypothetical protein
MPYLGSTPSPSALTSGSIADGAITTAKFATGAVDAAAIATNAVDSAEIAAGAVDLAHLSTTGSAGSGNFLRGDNSWQAAAQFANWSQSSGHLTPDNATYGIHLGVATATAANLLDDYEEGTFTATARLGGAAGTSNGTATMNYTKIGKQVHVAGSVTFASTKSGSGNIAISGLPFTVAVSARAAFMIGDRINATLLATNASATVVNFYVMTSSTGGTLTNATDSIMGTGGGKSIWISLTYFV